MLKYQFDWAIVLSGKYFDWLVSGVKVTIQLSAASIALAFLIGLIIAVMRMSKVRPIRWFAHGYLEFFRNTPLLVQIFFWYFGSYKILPMAVNDWLVSTNFEFASAVIALTIYTSAFIAPRTSARESSPSRRSRWRPQEAPDSRISARCSTSSCRRRYGSPSRP
jgi:polar amino acid transport system permease protein